MALTGKLVIVVLGLSIMSALPSYAQLGGGQQDAASILNGMPPDVLAKVAPKIGMMVQGLLIKAPVNKAKKLSPNSQVHSTTIAVCRP